MPTDTPTQQLKEYRPTDRETDRQTRHGMETLTFQGGENAPNISVRIMKYHIYFISKE